MENLKYKLISEWARTIRLCCILIHVERESQRWYLRGYWRDTGCHSCGVSFSVVMVHFFLHNKYEIKCTAIGFVLQISAPLYAGLIGWHIIELRDSS